MSLRVEYSLLCTMFQDGDEEAFEPIWERIEKLVHNMIPKYFGLRKNSILYDDAVSEAMFAVYRAAKLYDINRGISFTTYAARAIRNRIVDLLKSWNKVPTFAQPNWAEQSFEDFIIIVADNAWLFAEEAESNILFEELNRGIAAGLKGDLLTVYSGLIAGFPCDMIMDLLCWTKSYFEEQLILLEITIRNMLENDCDLKTEY